MSTNDKKNGYFIFTKFITLRNGKRLYASQVGKNCFKIWVTGPKKPKK